MNPKLSLLAFAVMLLSAAYLPAQEGDGSKLDQIKESSAATGRPMLVVAGEAAN